MPASLIDQITHHERDVARQFDELTTQRVIIASQLEGATESWNRAQGALQMLRLLIRQAAPPEPESEEVVDET